MIGTIIIDGAPVVSMDDDGSFFAIGQDYEPLADHLNITHHALEAARPFDHLQRFGFLAIHRAADAIGGKVALAEPITPVPEGTVN